MVLAQKGIQYNIKAIGFHMVGSVSPGDFLRCRKIFEILKMKIDHISTLTQEEADRMLLCIHHPITFHGHIIKNLDFGGRDLKDIFFAGIWIEDTSFRSTCCDNTSFYGTFLVDVDFSGADLHNAIFEDALLSGCNLRGIKAPLWKKVYLWLKNF